MSLILSQGSKAIINGWWHRRKWYRYQRKKGLIPKWFQKQSWHQKSALQQTILDARFPVSIFVSTAHGGNALCKPILEATKHRTIEGSHTHTVFANDIFLSLPSRNWWRCRSSSETLWLERYDTFKMYKYCTILVASRARFAKACFGANVLIAVQVYSIMHATISFSQKLHNTLGLFLQPVADTVCFSP